MRTKFFFTFFLLVAAPINASQLVVGQDGVQTVQLSPRGDYLVIHRREDESDHIYVIDLENVTYSAEYTAKAPQRVVALSWLDNNDVVLSLGADAQYEPAPMSNGQIRLLAVTGGTRELPVDGTSMSSLSVIDSLPYVADQLLVTDDSRGFVYEFNVETGEAVSIDPPTVASAQLIASPNGRYLVAEGTAERNGSRLMALDREEDEGWQDIVSSIRPQSVTNTGLIYGLAGKIAALVTVDISTGQSMTLFQDERHDVEHVMFNASRDAVAARFHPGFPAWQYLQDTDRFSQLHKSLRAALPASDVMIVSANGAATKFVAGVVRDNRPIEYFLIDGIANATQRLIDGGSGLFVLGLNSDNDYSMQPFEVETNEGASVVGLISVPVEESPGPKPAVVLLSDSNRQSEWTWGFDEEADYFSRQGFATIMINHEGSDLLRNEGSIWSAAVRRTQDVVAWAIDSNIIIEDRICLLGRTRGAELALAVASRVDGVRCVVSIGGEFYEESFTTSTVVNEDENFELLLVIGADDNSDYLASLDWLENVLDDRNIRTKRLFLEKERRLPTSRENEVRMLAAIQQFVNRSVGTDRLQPILPATRSQITVIDNVLADFVDRAQAQSFARAQSWLSRENNVVRRALSDEQWAIYRDLVSRLGGNYQRTGLDVNRRSTPGRGNVRSFDVPGGGTRSNRQN